MIHVFRAQIGGCNGTPSKFSLDALEKARELGATVVADGQGLIVNDRKNRLNGEILRDFRIYAPFILAQLRREHYERTAIR